MEKFWMVLIDGTRATTYKHSSIESARREADRLLKQYYSNRADVGVTILEAVEHGKIKSVPQMNWEPVLNGIYQGEEIEPADLPF